MIAGVVVTGGDACAQGAAQTSFNVPAGPLGRALTAFGRQAGLQVTYLTSIGTGKTSPGISGPATREQALARILQGTGLSYHFTNATTVAISQPAAAGGAGAAPSGAISLDTIDVQGETAWGPVNGFVASRSATATKTDTPIIEVPQSISVVTRDQMQTRQVQSLPETLRYTAGVHAEMGGNQTDFAVAMRGFNAGGTYLNGLRTLNNHSVDPYGLERVEVMRGPASVLYGQGQPSGIIGLVTKRPTEKALHEVQLQGGNFGRKGGAFDFGGPVTSDNTLLYRFTGLIRESGNGIDFSNDQRTFLSGAVTWRPTAATEITAFSVYQKTDFRANYGLPAQGTVLPNPNGRIPITRFIGEPNVSQRNAEMAVVGYNLEHRATDSVIFRQNLQYSHEGYNTDDIAPSGLQADLRTLNREAYRSRFSWDTFAIDNQAELKATTGVLHHTVLFGVDYRWRKSTETATYDGVVGPLDVFAPVYGSPVFIPADNYGPRQNQNFTGIYLQDQIKLDRWILTLGGRHDWADSKTTNIFNPNGTVTSQNDSAFTKRAGLGYEFDSGVVPYISYADSFLPISGTTFDGTPFKPESGVQYEAGIKYQPKDMNLRMTAAVYDLKRQNVTTPDPDHPGRSIQTGEVTSRGFEFEAVASLTSNLNLTAAYAYNDARVTRSNGANLGKRPVTMPPHVASLWADYTIREGALNGLGLGGGVRYVSASAGDSLNTFYAPAYTVVDAMARYDIDNWRVLINVSNLFDNQYVGGCFSPVQCNVGRVRTVIGTVTYRW
ncbi:ligand-gated channel [Nitrobacter winogradskyi]|nr:ligand-gated channel [Nitrobacter winogradskyi]